MRCSSSIYHRKKIIFTPLKAGDEGLLAGVLTNSHVDSYVSPGLHGTIYIYVKKTLRFVSILRKPQHASVISPFLMGRTVLVEIYRHEARRERGRRKGGRRE